jgi:hypothetical protein
MGEKITLLQYSREIKSNLEKLKIGDTLKAIKVENGLEKSIEIKLCKELNINYEIQKFLIYTWKKTKNVESNHRIFDNKIILDLDNNYENIFKRYYDLEDLSFLFDFVDVKQKL